MSLKKQIKNWCEKRINH